MRKNNRLLAVIFDFGGVLIDWSPYHLYRNFFTCDEEVARFLEEIDFKRWNLELDRGYPFDKAVAEHIQKYPQYADLISVFNDRWVETVGGPILETIEILKELKTAGIPVYGLSNWSLEKYRLINDQFAFLDWLDDYMISGIVQKVKPEAEIYLALLKKIKRKAEDCVFVDDSPENIEGAKRLGFKTVLYQNPVDLRTELTRLGFRY